jgi:hypothetical protein
MNELDGFPVTARMYSACMRQLPVKIGLWRVPWASLSDLWSAMGFAIHDAAPELNVLSNCNWNTAGDVLEVLESLSDLRDIMRANREVIAQHEAKEKTHFGNSMVAHLSELLTAIDEYLALYDLCKERDK